MKMVKILMGLVAIAIMLMKLAMAADYTVGDPNGGWDQSTDLATWASLLTFSQGDNLIFQFAINHDVTEVSEADFDSCTATNPLLPRRNGGSAVIPLTSAGSRYFICGTGGHCLGGMKLQIDTIATSAPPPPATLPPPPLSTTPPSLPPPPPSTTPSIRSSPPTPSVSRPVSPPPPSSTPAIRSPPPTSSVGRPGSPPPLKSISPLPPPSKAAANNPTLPPASAPPASQSLPPPPFPSSAAKFNFVSALSTACSGFVIMAFLNL